MLAYDAYVWFGYLRWMCREGRLQVITETTLVRIRLLVQIRLLNSVAAQHTVEFQWLEHLWDDGNLFETWIVRWIDHDASSANGVNLGKSLRSSAQ